MPPAWQVRTVDRADVIQAEESALEHVAAVRVLPVDPPGEVDQQLVEQPAEEIEVASLIDREHLECGPRLHRRVDVAEVPFVGRERPVRVLEPFPAQQDDLVLGEGRIQVRERHAVKAQVPGGEPGVLPLVRHRHDVEGVKVAPPDVAAQPPPRRRGRLGGITIQPPGHLEVVELLAPQQAREGLPHHHGLVSAGTGRCQAGVELVRFRPPLIQNLNELAQEWPIVAGLPRRGPQAQPQLGGGARREGQPVPEGAFGALAVRVDRGRAGDDVVVDAILGVRGRRGGVVQARQVRFVFAKQYGGTAAVRAVAADQLQFAEEGVRHPDGRVAGRLQHRLGRAGVPRPGVAEPRGRQDVQGFGVRAGVLHRHVHQHVAGAVLGVADLDDPVPVTVERAGVEQLVLGLEPVAGGVRGDQVVIGEGPLGVVIAPPVPGVAGHRVEVPPVFLDVLAVVALRPGQPEEPLLEDGVAPIPQSEPQAQPLLDVAEAGQAVLTPPVRPGPGVVVREVVPRRAVLAVVLADRSPLALSDVRAPQVPVAGLMQPVLELTETLNSLSLRVHHDPFTPSGFSARPLPGDGAPDSRV